MMYARAIPPALSADQLNRITTDHGCTLPRGDVIAIKDLDTFEALCKDLACDGTTLELIDQRDAFPSRMTEHETTILSAGWLARELREKHRDRGG